MIHPLPSHFHSWRVKLKFSSNEIRSNRLKKVQSKFTTLQITFNFPFERKHKLITIAQFTKQSRIIQHPITREEKKNLNQHSELTIFLAASATHYKNLSPRKGDQLFFRNFTISSINKPSNYKIADIYIYPSSRACGWRWCAEQEVE